MKVLIAVFLTVVLFSHVSAQESKKSVSPKKIEIDSNYDGTIDRIESYNTNGVVQKVIIDNNYDGAMDEWLSYSEGAIVKSKKDTNNDGKPDAWITY